MSEWSVHELEGRLPSSYLGLDRPPEEVIEGRVPIEYIGYDRKHPEKFRPSKITDDVSDKKDRFKCPGIRAYPQVDEQLRRLAVGGRR